MKRFLQFVLLLAGLVAIAVVASRLRERGAVPAADLPEGDRGEPAATAEAPAPAEAEDLARVWGIGPVYRTRLAEVGITTFAHLAAADPAAVAAATGVPAARAADWVAQAGALAGR